jgi:hypothetical protein
LIHRLLRLEEVLDIREIGGIFCKVMIIQNTARCDSSNPTIPNIPTNIPGSGERSFLQTDLPLEQEPFPEEPTAQSSPLSVLNSDRLVDIPVDEFHFLLFIRQVYT